MSCLVYLHCLRVFHIYTVIIYSVVPENPKGPGRLEWFRVSHFIQRMKQRESKANQEFFESKNFVYSSMFDEANRLIFVVPLVHYAFFILSILLCGQRHDDPLVWILATQFCGDRHCDSVAREQRLSSEPGIRGIRVEEWESLSMLPARIVRGGGKSEVGTLLGHCEDTCEEPFGICL